MTLEDRVLRLERSQSRWRLGCIAFALLSLCLIAIGAEPVDPFANPEEKRQTQTFDVISCHKLMFTNDDGKVMGMMSGVQKDGDFIAFFGAHEDTLGLIASNGGAQLSIHNGRYDASVATNKAGAGISVKTLDKDVGGLMASSSGGVVVLTDMSGHTGTLGPADISGGASAKRGSGQTAR
jgi:hypothetical protein